MSNRRDEGITHTTTGPITPEEFFSENRPPGQYTLLAFDHQGILRACDLEDVARHIFFELNEQPHRFPKIERVADFEIGD